MKTYVFTFYTGFVASCLLEADPRAFSRFREYLTVEPTQVEVEGSVARKPFTLRNYVSALCIRFVASSSLEGALMPFCMPSLTNAVVEGPA